MRQAGLGPLWRRKRTSRAFWLSPDSVESGLQGPAGSACFALSANSKFDRIVEIIDIDLPRPRRLDKLPERFHEYSTRIRNIFKSKGVLAMD
jgi:hypothetical protein